MKKFLTAALAGVLAASMLFTGCGKKKAESKIPETIVVGTNAEFPPFEFVNKDKKVDGFDIAVMKEIGKRVGSKVEIRNMEFKSLVGSMESGNLDVIAAGMTVTEEREEAVDFSDSYYNANQYVIEKSSGKIDIKKKEDLENLTIAVQEGTTGDILATKEIKGSDVKRFRKGVDAVMDLKKGGSDVVIIDSNPAQEFVKANKDLKIVKNLFEEEHYAFAVQKGNEKLKDAINDALKEMKKDGTFDKLIKQYIGQ